MPAAKIYSLGLEHCSCPMLLRKLHIVTCESDWHIHSRFLYSKIETMTMLILVNTYLVK